MVNTHEEKTFCVLKLEETQYVTVVYHHFRICYHKNPATRQSIYDWHKNFKNTEFSVKVEALETHKYKKIRWNKFELLSSAVWKNKRPGYVLSPYVLKNQQPTVWRTMRKCLRMTTYKLQILQALRKWW